jgi:hypothetical protein
MSINLHNYNNTILTNNVDLLKVYNFENKIRLGNTCDGGYVIGHINTQYDCLISAGLSANDDFSFEFMNKYSNINKNNCFGFDGTVNSAPLNLIDKMTFIKKNIGSVNDDANTNLSDLFEKYNNIFLKMDIEGGEWEWLSTMDETKLNKISQLVIEIHGITNESWHSITTNSFNSNYIEKADSLKKINQTHYLIHAHGNNADKVAYNGIPNVIELIYINKKHFDSVPELNKNPLPIIGLDFPNEKMCPDISLNFYPFVNNIDNNPFLIDIPDKDEYTIEDYINIQNKLNSKNIDLILEKLYKTHENKFYHLSDFKNRISRGILQNLIDDTSNLLPTKNVYKIGNGGNGQNCFVCCTPFTHKINNNESNNSRFIASQQILKSLEAVGFNGYFYLFNGGFPNPTGIEMKYAGVPYCFKIFMMLEAQKMGFNNVIWIDSGCYALNNPQTLFDKLDKHPVLIKSISSGNNYDNMVFKQTQQLLNLINNNNIQSAYYIETIVFGLNLESKIVQNFIKEYYELVKLGWPFFSIFPEEIVFSSLFNKPEYIFLLKNQDNHNFQVHEKNMNEIMAKKSGFYFHHKKYLQLSNENKSIKPKNIPYFVTFNNIGGRFGNQLFRYVASKLFTLLFGHTYISRETVPLNSEFIIVDETNISEYLQNANISSNKNIVLQGYFQKSELFVNYHKQLIELIFNSLNDDHFCMDDKIYNINEYLIKSTHNIKLKPNDIVVSLRLDDFIQYPCKTSDIIPPQYYIELLENMKVKNEKVYIVCDKLKHNWEFKYLEFFKKWNPILIQESLINDIALMRDSNILIHSNSSLCWIISFLSYKDTRIIPYTPKIYINQNQSLTKIADTDILNYISPLSHDEVHNLDVNNINVIPFSFSIPDECVVASIPEKKHLLASLIPGDLTTYTFDKYKENEYNDMYRKSRFAITKMKGGWDCLRHYEILMNGCIPLFENLNDCPKYTMISYPKELNDEAYQLYYNWCENEECIAKYNNLCLKFLEHTRKNCTTSAAAKYFLKNIKNGDKVKNILLITGHHGANYNREMLWIGLKRYIKSINGVAVEYDKMPFLYDDFDNFSKHKYYDSACFTFPKRLQKDDDYNMSEKEIIDKINSNFWDLIIYGKVGPDEFCTFPYYDIVKTKYNKNQIAFVFGGDEIFDLTITDNESYHINMFNRYIYYKPYSDYLNYYKQFGTCFVRELNK